MISLLRDAGLSDVVTGDPVETLADGFQFTEGPLWCPDGSLLFQDIKAERTYRLRPDRSVDAGPRADRRGQRPDLRAPTAGSSSASRTAGRVSRMSADGSGVETVVETWSGKRLNSPNDIVCRSDGLIYFTDPPYGVAPKDRELSLPGRLLLDGQGAAQPPGRRLREAQRAGLLARRAHPLRLRHGRAITSGRSPSSRRGVWQPAPSRVFAQLDPEQPGGPDGMKVDRDGRVYVAVAQGVWVFEPEGRLLGIIAPTETAVQPRLVRPRRQDAGDDGGRYGVPGPPPRRRDRAAVPTQAGVSRVQAQESSGVR